MVYLEKILGWGFHIESLGAHFDIRVTDLTEGESENLDSLDFRILKTKMSMNYCGVLHDIIQCFEFKIRIHKPNPWAFTIND